MIVAFDKMHALGNDFVMLDSAQFPSDYIGVGATLFDRSIITAISNRIFGVGCDCVVLYRISDEGDGPPDSVSAVFFNSDGGIAEICGNASRGLGLLMKMRHNVSRITMESNQKQYLIQTADEDDITVDCEPPDVVGLNKSDSTILKLEMDLVRDATLSDYIISYVSAGNPHLIFFLDRDLPEQNVKTLGRRFAIHPLFPNGVNVSFARIIADDQIATTVFERGAGLTMACGSGACATALAARTNGLVKSNNIFVHQRGGSLRILINQDGSYRQTGPATYVFRGEIGLDPEAVEKFASINFS
jgi:diaminopimelate epimerase